MALVLFSGGCDSTYLLANLLRGYFLADENGATDNGPVSPDKIPQIRTIAVTHPQIEARDESRAARKAVLAKLRKLKHPIRQGGFEGEGKRGIDHGEVKILQQGIHTAWCSGLLQPPIWLFTAIPYLEENEDLYVGYVRGDDIWHYKQILLELFDRLKRLTQRNGRLIFPLEWVDKHDIIEYLKRANLDKDVWYCEDPKTPFKPCKKCKSCETHKLALLQYEEKQAENTKKLGARKPKSLEKANGRSARTKRGQGRNRNQPRKQSNARRSRKS